MSFPGLPPLPKSLSTVEGSYRNIPSALSRTARVSNEVNSNNRNSNSNISNLDTQMAVLQREMYGLRQLDLSLLSQLWALNESIQEYQAILQEQETLSPPSPSPSDINSMSSDCDEDLTLSSSMIINPKSPPQQQQSQEQQHNIYQSITANQIRPILQQRMRGAPPPPPPARKAPQRPV